MERSGSHNPVELISQLDLSEIVALRSVLNGQWSNVANRERLEREKSLEELRVYTPDRITTPDFDPEAIDTYLERIRDVNGGEQQLFDYEKLRPYRIEYGVWAKEYLGRPGTLQRMPSEFDGLRVATIADSLALNLYATTVAARSIALRSFQVRRNATLRAHFPGASLLSSHHFLYDARKLPITGEHIAQVRAKIEVLPFEAPCPDIFQLSDVDRNNIVETLGRDWEAMLAILHAHTPDLITFPSTLRATPLAHLSSTDLQEAITNNPDLSPRNICQAFLRGADRFYTQIDVLKRKKAGLARPVRLPHAPATTPDTSPEVAVADLTIQKRSEIETLLADPEVNADVQHMPFGTTIALTEPTVEGQKPRLVYRQQVNSIIDKNLQLLGRGLHALLPNQSAKGVALIRWDTFNVGEALRASFAGPLSDLTMTRLPVSEADLQARLPKTKLRAEDVSEIVFAIHMRSSGRGPSQATLRLMLAVYTGSPRDTITKTAWRPRSTGYDLVESLYAEASAAGRVVEAYHRSKPLRGGLPGLGKN